MGKTRSNANALSDAWRLAIFAGAIVLPLLVTSCGKKDQEGEKKTVQKSADDTELSPQELQNVAQREGISVEELKKSDDFDPYFNLKIVLVEEGGQLGSVISNSCRRP